MTSTEKDNKAAGASADDAVPYNVTDAPSSSTGSNANNSPTNASTENAKKDENPFNSDNTHDSDIDDSDLQVHPAVTNGATTTATATATNTTTTTTPPPATAPPTSHLEAERLAKLAILTDAFPTVEKEICEFVLESHRGNVEASINALLEMSDPEYRPEPPQQQQQQRQPVQPAAPQHRPQPPQQTHVFPGAQPPLPQRSSPAQEDVDAAASEFARMRVQQQPRTEIDPILLASTSTSEQQLRADEDFARTLAAMDEYRARREQPRPQQHGDQGPSFTQEIKELVDEELPKIKEKLNTAADSAKKKVNEWYEKFKAARAEAAEREAMQRERANASNQAYYRDDYRHDIYRQDTRDFDREPIRYGERRDSDEPLARNRATPPLPARRDSSGASAAVNQATSTQAPDVRRTTTVEDVVDDKGK
ncbi:hypothetical protein BGW42_007757 [Actinomortierella wolfii]|nr:hypothetical protein BGW42_007757 [Actinomortierella wolfii]